MDRNNSFSDQELINMLRNGSNEKQAQAFEIIYLNHKKYCIGFMKSKFGEREELMDIYHNAVIVFRENVNKPEWQLTCRIQTFLNSICFHQGLTAFGKPKISLGPDDDIEKITDWFPPMEESLNAERVRIIVSILNDKTKTTEICYNILTRRFYLNQLYEIISHAMGYKNARTAITRGYTCMEILRKEVNKRLGGNNV